MALPSLDLSEFGGNKNPELDLSEFGQAPKPPSGIAYQAGDIAKGVKSGASDLARSGENFGRSLEGGFAGIGNRLGIVSDQTKQAIDDANVAAIKQNMDYVPPEDSQPTGFAGNVAKGLTSMAPAIGIGLLNPLAGVAAFGAQGAWQGGENAINEGDSVANAQLKAVGQGALNTVLGGVVGGAGNKVLEALPYVGKAFAPAAADTAAGIGARMVQGAGTMAAFKPAGTALDYAADTATGETQGKNYDWMPTAADLATGALMVLPHSAMEYVGRNNIPVATTQLADGTNALFHKNGTPFSSFNAAQFFIKANKLDGYEVNQVTERSFNPDSKTDKPIGYAVSPAKAVEPAAEQPQTEQPATTPTGEPPLTDENIPFDYKPPESVLNANTADDAIAAAKASVMNAPAGALSDAAKVGELSGANDLERAKQQIANQPQEPLNAEKPIEEAAKTEPQQAQPEQAPESTRLDYADWITQKGMPDSEAAQIQWNQEYQKGKVDAQQLQQNDTGNSKALGGQDGTSTVSADENGGLDTGTVSGRSDNGKSGAATGVSGNDGGLRDGRGTGATGATELQPGDRTGNGTDQPVSNATGNDAVAPTKAQAFAQKIAASRAEAAKVVDKSAKVVEPVAIERKSPPLTMEGAKRTAARLEAQGFGKSEIIDHPTAKGMYDVVPEGYSKEHGAKIAAPEVKRPELIPKSQREAAKAEQVANPNKATYSTFKNGDMIRVSADGIAPAMFGVKFEKQAKEYYEGLKASDNPKKFAEDWSKKVKAESQPDTQHDEAAKVNDVQPGLVALTGHEFGDELHGKELRSAATSYARDQFVGKSYRNKSTNSDIDVSWQGIKHAVAGANDIELRAIHALPDILQSAKLKSSEEDHSGRTDIIAAHRYQATISINGEKLDIGVVVREKADGHKFYDQFVIKQKTPTGTSEAASQRTTKLDDQPTVGADLNIPHLSEKSKPAVPVVKQSLTTEAKPAAAKTEPAGGEGKAAEIPDYAKAAGIKDWKTTQKRGVTTIIADAPAIAKQALSKAANWIYGDIPSAEKYLATEIVRQTNIEGGKELALRTLANMYDAKAQSATEPNQKERFQATADGLRSVNSKATDISFSRSKSNEDDNQPKQRFYSQLRNVVRDAPERMFNTGKGTALWLDANASKLGVKKDELYWSGVTDWMKTQGKVSKADVLDYLDKGGVQVKEVMLGERDMSVVEAWWNDEGGANEETPFSELSAAEQRAASEQYQQDAGDYQEEGAPKFASYQLPGGENYKELLLTLPEVEKTPLSRSDFRVEKDGEKYVAYQDGKSVARMSTEGQIDEFIKGEINRESYVASKNANFKSQHYDQPNIAAHIRFNERTDAEGKKVLFVEEIQSDWGQKGKKEGFDNEAAFQALIKQRDAAPDDSPQQDELQRQIDAMGRNGGKGVPSAPFVTDTKSWTSLALKHVISYAVDHGFDKVAWTNGEQQAARYDLSKQIDTVHSDKQTDGSYRLTITPKGRSPIWADDIKEGELADHVGKELAEKIVRDSAKQDNSLITKLPDGYKISIDRMSDPENKYTMIPPGQVHGMPFAGRHPNEESTIKAALEKINAEKDKGITYSGLDLKVGGEGMKGYYDGIVPQVANDILRKMSGGKVEPVTIETQAPLTRGDGSVMKGIKTDQSGFTITPELRAKVTNEGMPQFSRSEKSSTENPDRAAAFIAKLDDVENHTTKQGILDHFETRLRSWLPTINKLLEKGDAGQRNGLVIGSESENMQRAAELLAKANGTSVEDAKASLSASMQASESQRLAHADTYGKPLAAAPDTYGKPLPEISDGYGKPLRDLPGDPDHLHGWDVTRQDGTHVYFSKDNKTDAYYLPKIGMMFVNADNISAESALAKIVHEVTHATDSAELNAEVSKRIFVNSKDKVFGDDADRQAKFLEGVAKKEGYKSVDEFYSKDADKFMSVTTTYRKLHQLDGKNSTDIYGRVRDRMEQAGETGNSKEATAYLMEEAMLMGKTAGHSRLDQGFFEWAQKGLPEFVVDTLKKWTASIRASMFKRGVWIKASDLSIDDFLAVARSNMKDLANDRVQAVDNAVAPQRSEAERLKHEDTYGKPLPETPDTYGKPLKELPEEHKTGWDITKQDGTHIRFSKSATEEKTKELNDQLADQLGEKWRNAYALDNAGFTHQNGVADAIKSVFGTEVIPVKPTGEEFNGMAGMQLKGKIYVNTAERGNYGFVQLAGHELLHDLRRKSPYLYDYFADKAGSYIARGGVEKYQKYLDGADVNGIHTLDSAKEEMLSDFAGDAFADPKFLKMMAKENPSKFTELVNAVKTWFTKVALKLQGKGFGSSEYFNDVHGLRRYLADVLHVYAEDKSSRGIDSVPEVKFSKSATADAIPSPMDAMKEKLGKSRLRMQDELQEVKPQWLDKVKASFDSVKTGLNELKESYLSNGTYDDKQKIIGELTGAKQEKDFKLAKVAKQLIADHAPDRRTAMARYAEAGGDMELLKKWADTEPAQFRKGLTDAMNLTPKEKETAAAIRKQSDDFAHLAQESGILESLIENYVRHEWERVTPEGESLIAMANSGILNGHPREAMQRIFATNHDGIMTGAIPKNMDIAHQFIAGQQSIRSAIAARKAMADLMHSNEKDGRPTTVVGGAGSMIEEGGEEKPYFVKANVKPKDMGDYRLIDHSAMRGWKWVGSDAEGKPILMQGNMYVHPDAYKHLNALLGRSAIRDYTVDPSVPLIGGTHPGDMALRAGAYIKATLLSGTPFHQFHIGEHALFHGVNPLNAPEIDFSKKATFNGQEYDILREGVNHGMMVFNHNAMQAFGEGLAGGGALHQIPKVGDQIQRYGEYLFQDYIPRLKAAMFEKAVARDVEHSAEDLKSGKLTMDQIFQRQAKHSNDAFGEQNYKYMGRNPTLQDAYKLALLAPDFLESRMKFFGAAFTPGGREQKIALIKGAIIMGIGAQLINLMFGDDHKTHWDRPFSAIIGGREYSPRSVVGDIAHAVTDPRSFLYNRVNPLWGKPPIELLSGRDKNGQKESLQDGMTSIIKSWTPIGVQGVFKNNNGQTQLQAVMGALLNSIGVGNFASRTAAEKKINDINFDRMTVGGKTAQEKKRYDGFSSIKDDYMMGTLNSMDEVLAKAKEDDIVLTKTQMLQIRMSRDTSPKAKAQVIEHKMNHFSAEDTMVVWDKMSDEEKDTYRNFVRGKIMRSHTMPGPDKREALKSIAP